MQIKFIMSVFLSGFLLSSCSTFDFSRRVVQQGNLLTVQKVNALKVGMTKHEVVAVVGTSLVSPLFNEDRWDYAYTWRQGGKQDNRYLVLYFKQGRLVKIDKELPESISAL